LANVSKVFKQDFLMITWSKETSFGFEKIGEDWKSIFSKLYSPSNKPSIFSKRLILWRKSWATFLNFVAEIKLNIFSWLSEKFQLPCLTSCCSRFYFWKIIFVIFFHSIFTS